MRRASALGVLVTLLVLVVMLMVLSAVAASRAAAASTRQKADRAVTSARSGAEILVYVLRQVSDSNRVAADHTPSQLSEAIRNELADLEMTGVTFGVDGRNISVSSVILNSATSQSFTAKITDDGDGDITVDVMGLAGDIPRMLRLKYNLRTGAHLIFDPAATS